MRKETSYTYCIVYKVLLFFWTFWSSVTTALVDKSSMGEPLGESWKGCGGSTSSFTWVIKVRQRGDR